MRVLMTADTVGGVWSYAMELAKGLAEHGISVALATKGARLTADQREEALELPGLELFESDYRCEWMDEPWGDVARCSEWLLGLAARLRPDLVHLNDYVHGALPFGAPTVVGGHSCVLSWWAAVRRSPLPPEWERYRAEVTRGLRGASAVVAPSGAMLRALEAHYGPLGTARVIHNGRRPERFPPGEKEELVLSAGRLWDEAKNVAALEAIARRLPWPVYVAGEARGGAAPGSYRLGRLSSRALAGWLARASIYALPARYEPFGLSVLEAALAGCALVLGDVESLRELWDGAAVFVPPDDRDALRHELERLMAHRSYREALADCGRRRALKLPAHRMADEYASLYRGLASKEVNACAS